MKNQGTNLGMVFLGDVLSGSSIVPWYGVFACVFW